MKISVARETFPGEQRVALVPSNVPLLSKAGLEVMVQSGAGEAAGFSDRQYEEKGAHVVPARDEALAADAILCVRFGGAHGQAGREELSRLRAGQTVIGMCDPLGSPESVRESAPTGLRLMALELIPRITRAQSMDVLSSMATIAGYRAVLLAAVELPKMFPLMMTAAGTLSPARVLVIGAGVAGLQAIATARRLGAVVQAYDVRPAVRDQVESLGAKFVQLELETGEAEDRGGYAKALGEEFYARQRELMARIVGESDVVITTAAIPGQTSPLLVTQQAVEGMHPGSVIVDLAAERGGNCQLSQLDQKVKHQGVTILGPSNLPSEIPHHASQMYSKNICTFLLNMVADGQLTLDLTDQIVAETLLTRDGDVVHPRLRQLLDLPLLSDDTVADDKAQGA
jgi:NAD(P) transhydrogenase subunit alpha